MAVATRLTDQERRDRALSERDFQRQVTDLATALGWSYAHWRALQNRRGMWQVPVEGPLGKGWVDLTLLRVRDRRLIFAELKRELEHPTADQAAVLAALGALDHCPSGMHGTGPASWTEGLAAPAGAPCVATYVWRPSDLRDPIEDSVIGRVLR